MRPLRARAAFYHPGPARRPATEVPDECAALTGPTVLGYRSRTRMRHFFYVPGPA
jgi:hypothetical protein